VAEQCVPEVDKLRIVSNLLQFWTHQWLKRFGTPSKEEGHRQLLCIDGLAGLFWGVGHSLHSEPCNHRHIMDDHFLVRNLGFLGEVEMPEIQVEA